MVAVLVLHVIGDCIYTFIRLLLIIFDKYLHKKTLLKKKLKINYTAYGEHVITYVYII